MGQIQICRRRDGRYVVMLFVGEWLQLWASPVYRWYWMAKWMGRRDARAWLAGQPVGHMGMHAGFKILLEKVDL